MISTKKEPIETGRLMYNLAKELFPICRSITGNGVRKTLNIIKREIPELCIHEVESGTECFDWSIPLEWNISDAYVNDPDGNKIVDFKKNNLHVVGYSSSVDMVMTLDELKKHLYTSPMQPDAIPYVTSYYNRTWGFCITHNQYSKLKAGDYQVYINSSLENGSLTYGELIIPGKTKEEIFISTYICHPSLANNELSGPCVATYIAKWLSEQENHRYSYRIIFIPETIGSILYLSRHLHHLKKHVIAGFNVTCAGDERTYSYLPSRKGNTLADKVAVHVLKHIYPNFKRYSFVDRESDERQYCSPGVDLPLVSIMRSKYGTYQEYHTSKDDLSLITPDGLSGTYKVLRYCITCLEHNVKLKSTVICEPNLGKRNLSANISHKSGSADIQSRRARLIFSFADGENDLLDIAALMGVKMWELVELVDALKIEKLLISV